MKKILLCIFTILTVFGSAKVYAQSATFTTAAQNSNTPLADTVIGLASNNPSDNITATTAGGIKIKWKVIATNFPSDWLTAVLGICDNKLCYNNASNNVWNPTFGTGNLYTSYVYAQNPAGTFHMQMSFPGTGTTPGTFYMTISLSDSALTYQKTVTFIISNWAASVPNISGSQDDVTLYPNPANDEVNVIYNPNSNIKTIAIYNIIGKVLKVYNTLDNSSAKLNIDNVPSGIYFIRLMDNKGNIVATRKFTRQ